ncbi:MAG TPA: ABC transporter permease [Puia sp.]|nr:ABC transporter permease [Puia sp.]
MLKNYWKTAIRFLLKNRTFSFINIFGLAIGTLCCLYIVLYVQDQFSYDRHHRDARNIYRVTTDLILTGDRHNNATASPPIAPAIKHDFPEVVQFTRVVPTLGLTRHRGIVIAGFSEAGVDLARDRNAHRLVGGAPMAAAIRLPGATPLVDVWIGGFAGGDDRVADRESSGGAGGVGETCEEFAVRGVNFRAAQGCCHQKG